MPSVLIVEDHALFRSGLKQLIGIEPGLTVAGEAGDGLAGIRLAQSLRPDLILLDISMPELSGVEAIPRIREVAPGARILIVSMHATAGHVRAALKAGADGYLLKTADVHVLADNCDLSCKSFFNSLSCVKCPCFCKESVDICCCCVHSLSCNICYVVLEFLILSYEVCLSVNFYNNCFLSVFRN